MKSTLLLPNVFKPIGLIILIPATIAGIYLTVSGYEANWLNTHVFAFFNDSPLGKTEYFTFVDANVTNTIVGALFIIGALMVSFSKEKREDEFIANLRLSSLLWSVWVNYILLLLAFIFVYGTSF
ncbi:MAG TPA: hypothetical protein VMZ69_11765, partial [Saprospiraceae bacterium]|nr:hypothetical protein [Saprospiraceae bacterium]